MVRKKIRFLCVLAVIICFSTGCQSKTVSTIKITEADIIINGKDVDYADLKDRVYVEKVTLIDNNAIKQTYEEVVDFLKSNNIEYEEEQ